MKKAILSPLCSLTLCLSAVLLIAGLAAQIARAFVPNVILPPLDIPTLAALSLIALVLEAIFFGQQHRFWATSLIVGIVDFGLLSLCAGQALTALEALRVGIQQLRRQVLRFRALLLCAGLVLAVFLCARGFLWVRDHTELLPQPVTTVTARPMSDQARLTAWTAAGGHFRFPGLFQVSLADQRTPYLLQWELWDHQGLRQTWEVGRTACPEDLARHQDLATSVGMTMAPDLESWSTLTYTVSFLDETFTGALEAVPRLYDTLGVEQPAGRCPVDEAEGTILLYVPLPDDKGRLPAPRWTTPGQIETPVRENASVLLLKLYVL